MTKKSLAAIGVVLLVLALVLSACGGSQQSSSQGSNQGSSSSTASNNSSGGSNSGNSGSSASNSSASNSNSGNSGSSQASSGQPVHGGTLTVALNADPPLLDPAYSTAKIDRQVFMSLFDSLVTDDANLKIQPDLAKSWDISSDGTVYTFHLRQGVKFQDGTPFNAKAVKFNLQRDMKKASPRSSQLDVIKSIDVVDDYTVKVTLKKAFSPFLAALTDRAGMMVSPAAVKKYGDKGFRTHPVGTGPFEFVKRVKNSKIVLKRNPNYWQKGKPYLDQVIYKPFTDGTSRVLNLESGQVDLIGTVPPNQVKKLKNDNNLTLAMTDGLGFSGIWVNVKSKNLGNAKIRQALSLSLNRQAIVQTVFGDTAVPAFGPFPPAMWAHDSSLKPVQQDLSKAKQLVKDSGVSNPQFTLLVPTGQTSQQIASLIKAQAAQAGITVKIQQSEFGSVLDHMDKGTYDAALVGWSGRVDPDLDSYMFFAKDGGLNDSQYDNSKVTNLLTQARQTSDTAKRKQLYTQAAQIINQDNPYIFIYHAKEMKAYSNKVKNFKTTPDGMIRLTDVWLAKK